MANHDSDKLTTVVKPLNSQQEFLIGLVALDFNFSPFISRQGTRPHSGSRSKDKSLPNYLAILSKIARFPSP